MAKSLDDVIHQMAQVGLDVPARVDLAKAFANYLRWRPSCEKKQKKSAWARLFEYKAPSGKVYITGSFGWRDQTWKVEATATDWTPAERAEYIERMKAAEKAAAAERAKEGESAAEKAQRFWNKAREEGRSSYLDKKQVRAYGIRFSFRDQILIPLRDMEGKLQGLQWIGPESKVFGTGTIKEGRFHLIGEIQPGHPLAFAEGYATAATAHMAMGWPVVVCFDANNLEPVVTQFRKLYADLPFLMITDDDRYLLQRVCKRLAEFGVHTTPRELGALDQEHEWTLPGAGEDGADRLVMLKAGWAKDACGVAFIDASITVSGKSKPIVVDGAAGGLSIGVPDGVRTFTYKFENAGVSRATACAKRYKARLLVPEFADRESEPTDWNDLHVLAGLDAVREQLARQLEAPEAEKSRANGAPPGGRKGRGGGGGGDGDGERKRFVDFLKRYTLIYGTTTVWDAETRDILKIESLKLAYGKLVDWWLDHEDRLMVPKDHVVFDPTGKCQAPAYVNLFDRLPLDPDPEASCTLIVRHLYNLCQENDALFHWVACWLALPLQQLGTKMRTALVLHGRTEGTGKSLMMDIMRAIYGRYARSITQLQLQTEFTGWMSGQLLCIAEEVVSRQDRAHHKGLLQNLITNEQVQINEKNMPLRTETNHANFVFLSNDQIPMLLNTRDRRYTVINVETEHPPEYFAAIGEEMRNGGVAAFYHWLLKYPLKDFNAYTRPFENVDRKHLITLGMTPDQRFFAFWSRGMAGVPFCTCAARDLYAAFKAWCRVSGERFVANETVFGRTISGELERMRAPPKKKTRYLAHSEKSVIEGEMGGEPVKFQGIVYFVQADAERLQLVDDDEEAASKAAGPPDAPPVDVTVDAERDKRIQLFQRHLYALMGSARRTL